MGVNDSAWGEGVERVSRLRRDQGHGAGSLSLSFAGGGKEPGYWIPVGEVWGWQEPPFGEADLEQGRTCWIKESRKGKLQPQRFLRCCLQGSWLLRGLRIRCSRQTLLLAVSRDSQQRAHSAHELWWAACRWRVPPFLLTG